MSTDRDKHAGPFIPPKLSADRIQLLNRFRAQTKSLNNLLEAFDVHGVSTEAEQAKFFDNLANQGADLITSFRGLVQEQGGSARKRILHYLKNHLGQVIEGTTLEAVSGISDWARRVRELDVQEGYSIITHESDSGLRPGQYRLDSVKPDTERADWWRLKNRLKKDKRMSLQEKLLSLLRARRGRPVESADFLDVAQGKDWQAAMKQLQSKYTGCRISSSRNRKDLEPDEYVLEAD